MPEAAFELLADALAAQTCLHLVISGRRDDALVDFTKAVVRPVVVSDQPAWQFTLHFPRKVTHENLDSREALARATELMRFSFNQAALFTTEADYLIRARGDGTFRVMESAATHSTAAATNHNRAKQYLIPEGAPCPFLEGIGVMTADGKVRRAMYHKFRQINRFLELVDDAVAVLPAGRPLRVVDFGCGKSYLTFAMHHLLTVIHSREVQIVGLDREPQVIETCRALAEKLHLTGIEFRVGEIATHASDGPVDLAVSLHACDTATDLALAQAVRWQCAAVLAVPCCQHELAPQINCDDLAALTRHGVLKERFAALATDALRGALLEAHGYATQIVEFIDMEHTPKNLLIRAVRRERVDEAHRQERLAEYHRLRETLGVESFALARALDRMPDTNPAPGELHVRG